jgi:hypothetical protein
MKLEYPQQFPFWKVEIRWKNGLGGSGGYERIFSVVRVLGIREKIKKNPFGSALSAQSVLPSYLHLPKWKLLEYPNAII